MLRLSLHFHYIVLFYRFASRLPRSVDAVVGEIADLRGTAESLDDLPQLHKDELHIVQLT